MTPLVQAAARVLAVLLLAYPIMFYLGHDVLGLPALLALLGVLVLGRWLLMPGVDRRWRAAGALGVAVFLGAVAYWQSSALLKLYPVAANLALLGYGLHTLKYPPSAIERLVRALRRPVSDAGVGYTRGVTMLWCGFFAVNAVVAAYTALRAPTAVWAWYNGVLSYALAAGLFAGEFVYRGIYKRRVHAAGGGTPSSS